MTNGAPALQDKPTTLPMLDEILEIAPGLEANWPREGHPPGTLVNRAEPGGEPVEPGGGEPGGENEPAGGPEGEPPAGEEESFFDFDPSQIPDNADREWLGNQYGEMRKAFTQKTQGLAETRRAAEESQALIEGLRDPETMPHYLRLLGVDLADPQMLEMLGIGGGQAPDQELLDLLEDEPELEDRVGQLERERAEERQQREEVEMEQALDDLADQELEAIEGAWGRQLDEDEDAFIRHRAEAAPGPDGLPDYESAAKVLKGWLGRREQDWAKRRSEPGRGLPGGKPGGKALDPTNPEDRLALGAAAAERALASQQ